ncbi:MAG: RNA polymerase sigma factor [Vicinamibacterales bacterium]
MDRESELELVARLRAGDTAAFDVVYESFNARLFNFLARLSRRRDVAEDLLEETWLRVVDRAPRLDPETRLGPFLFTVARNLYVSYCRSRRVADSHAGELIGLWPYGTPPPTPFESAVANETDRRVELALATLPLAYREALLLVAVQGLRPAEAAEVCGIQPEAMRQRLSRARTLLAERLGHIDAPILARLKEVTT